MRAWTMALSLSWCLVAVEEPPACGGCDLHMLRKNRKQEQWLCRQQTPDENTTKLKQMIQGVFCRPLALWRGIAGLPPAFERLRPRSCSANNNHCAVAQGFLI